MSISTSLAEQMGGTSWIRRMFEEGLRLKRRFGEDQVADLALGNPVLEPPLEVLERLKTLAADPSPGTHRYMPNAGFTTTRASVAAYLERRTGAPYRTEHVVMTVGAGGGLNVVLKGLLDPGDEVMLLAPYFVEYRFYVANHGGRSVVVQTDERFRPDPNAVAQALTPRTRALVLNSPNNPTGVVYAAEDLDALGEVLTAASEAQGRPVYLVADEPYRALTYDGAVVPWPVRHYADTIHVTSFSKDLGIPGERIGYVAVPPASEHAATLTAAFTFALRILGFVNAPALQQRLVEGLLDVRVDLGGYAERRRRLLHALEDSGYEVVRPEGAFYMFPRVPGGRDDVEFVLSCLEERLLVVPGSGFGRPGHFRISYAVTERDVDLAVSALARAVRGPSKSLGR